MLTKKYDQHEFIHINIKEEHMLFLLMYSIILASTKNSQALNDENRCKSKN